MKRKKTQIIKKNINPAFQESFNFKADENDIETIGVRVTAMQHMPFPEKGRNIFYRLIKINKIFFHSQDMLSRDVLLMLPNLIGIIIICNCTMGVPWGLL